MFDRAELKSAAKTQIKGNIGILFLCLLVLAVIFFALGFITGLLPVLTAGNILLTVLSPFAGSIIAIVVAPPFAIGIIMIFLKLREGQRPQVGHLFNGFQIAGKAIWLDIIRGVFIMLWSMLLIVPGIVKTYAYMLAPYVLAENHGMTAREALNESKRITNGNKMNLFVLDLSFIPWFLLVTITFGIAAIYVFPYYSATVANAYKKIQAEQQEVVA